MCACSKHPAAFIVFAIQMSSSLPPPHANIQIWNGAGVRPTPPPSPAAVNAAGVGPAATLKGNAIPCYHIPSTIMRLQQSFISSNPQIIAVVLPPPAISCGCGTAAGVSQQIFQYEGPTVSVLLRDKNGRIPWACISDAFPACAADK